MELILRVVADVGLVVSIALNFCFYAQKEGEIFFFFEALKEFIN